MSAPQPPALTLRPVTPADAAAVTSLAHLAKASRGYPPEWMAQWRPTLTVSPEYLAGHPGWCAEERGELVGFCALEPSGEDWDLGHLWVLPGRQGTGVGRLLLRAALDEVGARGGVAMRIVSDPGAEAFYLRRGARRIGEIAAPMPGAPDRLLPVLRMEP